MAWEQFNVPVDVCQGVLPIRRWQLGKSNCTVAVPHGVVRVQFYRAGGVLDALLRQGRGRYRVGVGAAAPVSGVVRVEFNREAVVRRASSCWPAYMYAVPLAS